MHDPNEVLRDGGKQPIPARKQQPVIDPRRGRSPNADDQGGALDSDINADPAERLFPQRSPRTEQPAAIPNEPSAGYAPFKNLK